MVTFSVTLTDLLPSFQGHGILESNISKTVHFRDKVTKEQ